MDTIKILQETNDYFKVNVDTKYYTYTVSTDGYHFTLMKEDKDHCSINLDVTSVTNISSYSEMVEWISKNIKK